MLPYHFASSTVPLEGSWLFVQVTDSQRRELLSFHILSHCVLLVVYIEPTDDR